MMDKYGVKWFVVHGRDGAEMFIRAEGVDEVISRPPLSVTGMPTLAIRYRGGGEVVLEGRAAGEFLEQWQAQYDETD